MKIDTVVNMLLDGVTLRKCRDCYVRGNRLGGNDTDTIRDSFNYPVFHEGVGSWPYTKWKFKEPFDPKVALDIGGGIGGFAARTKRLFPECKVISIEPVHENRVLQELTLREMSPDGNWQLIDGVLNYFPETQTHFMNHKRFGCGGKLVSKDDTNLRLDRLYLYETLSAKNFTLRELIDLSGGKVDILKIDCEGAENGLIFNEDGEHAVHPDIELMKDIPIITGEWHGHEVVKPGKGYCNSRFVNTIHNELKETHNVIAHDIRHNDQLGNFFFWKRGM